LEWELSLFSLIGLLIIGGLVASITGCDSPSEHSEASAARLRLTASSLVVPADGGSSVTIQVFASQTGGTPLNAQIYAETTFGDFEETFPLAASSGIAKLTLNAPSFPGTAVVTVTAIGTNDNGYPDELRDSITINVVNPKYRVDLEGLNGVNSVALGYNGVFRAYVYDAQTGAIAHEGVPVRMKICSYSPNGANPGFIGGEVFYTSANGYATMTYTTDDTPQAPEGFAVIAAWAGELVPANADSCPSEDRVTYPGYDTLEVRVVNGTPTKTPTPTPTPTKTPTLTPIPTDTKTPTPSPTGTPPTPTKTPTSPFTTP
jgi:hypothetical protein